MSATQLDYTPVTLVMECRACKHLKTLENYKTKVNGGINKACNECCAKDRIKDAKTREKGCPCGKYRTKGQCKFCSDPIRTTAQRMVKSGKQADIKYDRFDYDNHVDTDFCMGLINSHKR